ncbi:MAG: S-layer homology domain-containing protein [Clostridiales bacterium]|nr:S-layer homology domain-containing protein [Clostridiales bacterium]
MKRRLLASALAVAMTVSSFTYVSFADETADETAAAEEIEVSDEALSGSAVLSDEEIGDEAESEEAEATIETAEAENADLASSDVLKWTIGATRTVSTSAGSITYDSDGNASTVVLAPDGSGKCSKNDEEYLYAVSQLDSSYNFVLEADMTINKYLTNGTSSQGQTTAGLVLMADPSNTAYSDGTGDNRHYNNMMLCTYLTDGGFAARTLDDGESAATYNTFFPVSDFTVTTGLTNLGPWHLTIEKSATSYMFKVEDTEGNSEIVYYETDTMFGDSIYAGFMAARDITATFDNVSLDIDPRQFTEIEILSPPSKTTYYVGENFDISGLVVQGNYIDPETGEEGSVILDNIEETYSISGFDNTSVGDKELLIGKAGCYASVPYTIRKMNVTAVNVTRVPYKNTYYEYQLVDINGLTGKFVFEDGSTESIGYSDVYDDEGIVVGESHNFRLYVNGKEVYDKESWFTAADGGATNLEIGYYSTDTKSDAGVVYKAPITISSYELESCFVAASPTKYEYTVGEEFIQSGLIFSAYYTDGTKTVIDTFDEDNYYVSGFDSSVLGTNTVTVTLANAPDTSASKYKGTFNLSIVARTTQLFLITQYPRTTFTNDMTVEEIQSLISEKMVVKVYYSDETYETIEEGVGYSITYPDIPTSGSKLLNGTYTVTVTPIGYNYDAESFEITIWDDTTHYWRRSVFGQSSNKSYWTNLEEADETGFSSSIFLSSWSGSGKITTGGNDGIVYYYTRFDADNNFTLKGDIEVVNYLATDDKSRSAQEGFGIQFRDTISLLSKEDGEEIAASYDDKYAAYGETGDHVFFDATASGSFPSGISTYADSGKVPVSKVEDAYIDRYGEPVPIRLNTTQEYSDMVLAGTFTAGTYPSDPTSSSYYFNSHKQRINMYIRTGVYDSFSTDQTGVVNYGPYCLYGTTGDEPTGEFYPKTGDVYTITLSRINGGYFEECTIKAVGESNADFSDWVGKTFTKSWYWDVEYDIDEDPLTNTDDTTIYAGFCAARWAEINVSNIEWYDSAVATDISYVEEEYSYSSPGITLVSPTFTKNSTYNLILKATNSYGGTAIIKLNDEVIANNEKITKRNCTYKVQLIDNAVNKLEVYYVPDANDDLTTYDPVTLTKEISCCSSIYSDTEDLYVAPDVDYDGYTGVLGSVAGTGERNSPITVDAAISLLNTGQKIIVLDGIYYRDDTVTIEESNCGTKSHMKYMWADEGANPIFDMQDGAEGLDLSGNYWWLKGMTFRYAADNNKGGSLSGSDNICENLKFHDNGTTGFQVSGSGSETFDEWPARNLIVYCEVWNNHDSSGNNADGFGCKLTVGNGNIFKNCVSHHNLDDGWDFYSKTVSGDIGATVLEDCISYKCTYYLNDDGSDELYFKGSGNGFKLGGDSIYIGHYVKDCIAFQNENSGFSSNANPGLKFRNCIGFKNGGANYSLYSGLETGKLRYNYNLDGCVSLYNSSADSLGTVNKDTDMVDLVLYDSDGNQVYDEDGNAIVVTDSEGNAIQVPKYPNTSENDTMIATLLETYPEAAEAINNYSLTIHHLSDLIAVAKATNAERVAIIDLYRSAENIPIISDTNYWILSKGSSNQCGVNASGETFDLSWLESYNVNDMVTNGFISQDDEGEYIRNGFLVRTEGHEYEYRDDQSDLPAYPDTYYLKFPDAEVYTGVDEAATETTTAAARKNSGSGGGGGGGSSAPKTAAEAATEAAAEAVTDNSDISDSKVPESSEAAPAAEEKAYKFDDISSRPWAAEAIEALAAKGIISGISATKFNPDANITRGDFCVIIAKAAGFTGGDGATDFSDVDAAKYYAPYVAYAAENGIVNGYDDGSFKPEAPISRQEMMVVVARFLGADGTDDTEALSSFSDGSDVSAWAAPYVAYLANKGIVQGTDTGLKPLEAITRAQAAVLVYNATNA